MSSPIAPIQRVARDDINLQFFTGVGIFEDPSPYLPMLRRSDALARVAVCRHKERATALDIKFKRKNEPWPADYDHEDDEGRSDLLAEVPAAVLLKNDMAHGLWRVCNTYGFTWDDAVQVKATYMPVTFSGGVCEWLLGDIRKRHTNPRTRDKQPRLEMPSGSLTHGYIMGGITFYDFVVEGEPWPDDEYVEEHRVILRARDASRCR